VSNGFCCSFACLRHFSTGHALLPENISVVKSAGLENEQGEMEISSHVKQFTGMEIIQMEKSLSLHRILHLVLSGNQVSFCTSRCRITAHTSLWF
jgi:hypothetical protein